MRTPEEALLLPSARLSAEQMAAVDRLEQEIDRQIGERMSRGGVQVDIAETRAAVVTELQCRIRRRGWLLQTWAKEEPSRLTGEKQITGFRLVLAPPEDAIGQVAELVASA